MELQLLKNDHFEQKLDYFFLHFRTVKYDNFLVSPDNTVAVRQSRWNFSRKKHLLPITLLHKIRIELSNKYTIAFPINPWKPDQKEMPSSYNN